MGDQVELPKQTPLFHAEHSDRYDRQALIRQYQDAFDCRLAIFVDTIFPPSITFFEELLYDASAAEDLHLLLWSPGGDGETAVRLVRSAQARCRELTVIIPDIAKSAATLLAMGAHRILMGPTSDLGPIDPQFQMPNGSLASAKDIIAALEEAEKAVEQRPDTYPLHAALLSDLTELMVQQARSAIARTGEQLEEALRSQPDRDESEVGQLVEGLREPLIELPKSHSAIFGSREAAAAGLPIVEADPDGDQWQMVWRLWAKYFVIGPAIYESANASRANPWQFGA